MEQISKDTCLKNFHVPSHLRQLCRSSQANSWGGRRFGKPSLALRGAFVGLRLQWGAAHLAPRGPPGSTGGRRRSARGWGPISWAADAWVAAGWEGEKWGDWMLNIFTTYLLCIYLLCFFSYLMIVFLIFDFVDFLLICKLHLFFDVFAWFFYTDVLVHFRVFECLLIWDGYCLYWLWTWRVSWNQRQGWNVLGDFGNKPNFFWPHFSGG